MVRQKEAKNAALLTAVVILLMSFTYVPDWSAVGVAEGCPLAARLVYSFFHASPVHAVVNAWCLLCIVFLYDVSIWRLLTAYIVAVAVPGFLLSEVPTVGLSCVCYFLLGSLIFEVKRKALLFVLYGSLYRGRLPVSLCQRPHSSVWLPCRAYGRLAQCPPVMLPDQEIKKAVSAILKENKRRLDAINVPFNPVSGLGSVGERVKVTISGFPIRVQWLPVKMMSVPLVRKLAECGDLDRFISETIAEDYTDEDRLKVIDAFVRVRSRHDFPFWAATFVTIQSKEPGEGEIPFKAHTSAKAVCSQIGGNASCRASYPSCASQGSSVGWLYDLADLHVLASGSSIRSPSIPLLSRRLRRHRLQSRRCMTAL